MTHDLINDESAETTAIATMDDVASEAELAALVPERFSVKDESSADWLVRKVVEADAHIRRVKEQAEREIRRTERERDFLLLRFGGDLQRWVKKQLQKDKGRRKSVLFLSGTAGFRQLAAKLVVEDEPTVIKWAKKHCRKAVVTVERLSKTVLNEHFESTGELGDGIRLEPVQERFYIK